MSILAILIQVAITLLVVALYHLWVSRNKQPASAPPVVVAPTPDAAEKFTGGRNDCRLKYLLLSQRR